MRATADIYAIRCKANRKVYVGSARRWTSRIKTHWWELDNDRHGNAYLQKAWRKYGESSFTAERLEVCPLKDRWTREQWWIDHLRSSEPVHGFNIMHSVMRLPCSKRMSKILKAYWAERWEDPEYAERRIAELRGLADKPGVRERMSQRKKANWKDPDYRSRVLAIRNEVNMTAEARANRSASTRSKWEDPEYRAKQMAERRARFSDPAFLEKLSVAARNRKPREPLAMR